MSIKYLLLLLLLIKSCVTAIEYNCYPCQCSNSSRADGRFAKCSKDSTPHLLLKIPSDLGIVQKIDISNQNLTYLEEYAFKKVNLLHLEILVLENCNIKTVDKTAFKNLTLLRNINLALNKIKELDSLIFEDNPRLGYINLKYNKLKTLDLNTFKKLPFLRVLDLSSNLLISVENDLSEHKYLEIVRLHHNYLETLNNQIFGNGRNLKSVTLYKNNWRCNCNLLSIFKLTENLYDFNGTLTICSSPKFLENRPWSALESSDFDCNPNIFILPNKEIVTDYYGNNVTLSCNAISEYNIDVYWLRRNGKILENNMYHLVSGNNGSSYWTNLTIIHVTTNDDGLYRCAIKYEHGYQEQYIAISVVRNITKNTIVKNQIEVTTITENEEVEEKKTPEVKILDDFEETTDNNNKNDTETQNIGYHLKKGFLVIISMGTIVVVAIAVSIIVYCVCYRNKRRLSKTSSVYSSQFVNAVNPNLNRNSMIRYSVEYSECEEESHHHDAGTPLRSFRYIDEDNLNFYPQSPIYSEPVDTIKRIIR